MLNSEQESECGTHLTNGYAAVAQPLQFWPQLGVDLNAIRANDAVIRPQRLRVRVTVCVHLLHLREHLATRVVRRKADVVRRMVVLQLAQSGPFQLVMTQRRSKLAVHRANQGCKKSG